MSIEPITPTEAAKQRATYLQYLVEEKVAVINNKLATYQPEANGDILIRMEPSKSRDQIMGLYARAGWSVSLCKDDLCVLVFRFSENSHQEGPYR